MFAAQKNSKATNAINEYIKKQNLPAQQVLDSPEHEAPIAKILYSHMPKMVKWSMKEDKFLEFYKNNKAMLLGSIFKK